MPVDILSFLNFHQISEEMCDPVAWTQKKELCFH